MEVMDKFSIMEGPFLFQKFTVKVDNEVLLYNAWKDVYPHLLEVQQEMKSFQVILKEAYAEISEKQYGYFINVLDGVKKEHFDVTASEIIGQWNTYLVKKTRELEKMWIVNRVARSRKAVRII